MVERYVEECLFSITSQLIPEVEIIIVNDGTKDSSMDLVYKVIRELDEVKQKQFVIISQSNQGQSVARNNAINIAHGQYIAFLDSDDYLSDNYFSTLLSYIDKYENVDIFSFSAIYFEDNTNKIIGYIADQIEEGRYVNDKFFLKKVFNECAWQSWSRIVRAGLLKETMFPVGILLEDVHVYAKLYLRDNLSIYHINKKMIYYRHREQSSVALVNQKLVDSYKQAIDFLKQYHGYKLIIANLSCRKLYVNYMIHLYYVDIGKFYLNIFTRYSLSNISLLYRVFMSISKKYLKNLLNKFTL